jgi:hypothetical protein
MELIKNHAVDALQLRIGLKATKKQPCGDHLQPGAAGALLFVAHGVADAFADRFPQMIGQARGRSPGGQPAWFEHHKAALQARDAWDGTQQGQGNPGGFARTGRGLEQNGGARRLS